MKLEPPADQDIIIVGASGDLAHRKLLPALYNLHVDGLLPRKGKIIGYARRPMSDEEFADMACSSVKDFSRRQVDDALWPSFAERLRFCSAREEGYDGIAKRSTER